MPMNPRLLRPLARRQAPAPSFSPASISGLAVWLDATASSTLFDAVSGGSQVAADGTVARWEDRSGNGWHATQGTQNNRPVMRASELNAKNALEFDGSDDWLQIAENGIGNGGDLTVLVALRFNSSLSGTRVILNKGDTATFGSTVWELEAGNPWFGYANNAWFASTGTAALPMNETVVVGGITIARVSQLLLNGENAGSASSEADGVNDIQQFIGVMAGGSSGAGNCPATIGEVLIYDAAVSTANLDALHSYLFAKWGVVL